MTNKKHNWEIKTSISLDYYIKVLQQKEQEKLDLAREIIESMPVDIRESNEEDEEDNFTWGWFHGEQARYKELQQWKESWIKKLNLKDDKQPRGT